MKSKFAPIEYEKLKTYSLEKRKSKVQRKNFFNINASSFIESLPDILAGKDIKEIIDISIKAKKDNKKIVLAMGAHVIKVGLNPLINELIKNKIVDLIALNGAGIIHDTELAISGQTSEDVDTAINDGHFGMCEDTAMFLNNAINNGYDEGLGLGEAIGKALADSNFSFVEDSIIYTAYTHNVPVTVHVAIGTDIIHLHPSAKGEAIGGASLRDFKIFSKVISELEEGIYFNIGSAVVLPEIFLKAVSLVRNLGYKLEKFYTVNIDFIKHYRPETNVVRRPTLKGGKGFSIVGHHEILLPLIFVNILNHFKK